MTRGRLLFCLIALSLLVSCGQSSPGDPDHPPLDPTLPPELRPSTTIVQATPAPTPLPTAVPSPRSCTDRATFITDVSIPDGTTIQAGASFTKIWRLKNIGTCTWDVSYALVFDHGEMMGETQLVPLTATVPPNETVDLSVTLTAPSSSGTYKGHWKLRNTEGQRFGVGPEAERAFWVEIVVP
ncbi:MAG: hypothetical protein JXA37_09920 [Chloroflexia bacterium]|nr:hypothetical protein [Chloroflexia bacterium]